MAWIFVWFLEEKPQPHWVTQVLRLEILSFLLISNQLIKQFGWISLSFYSVNQTPLANPSGMLVMADSALTLDLK